MTWVSAGISLGSEAFWKQGENQFPGADVSVWEQTGEAGNRRKCHHRVALAVVGPNLFRTWDSLSALIRVETPYRLAY